ncbi:PIG-L family deacetylase [Mycoplasmatota bacterium]|nr:PIG-L family deacetylase [Mycoplasmatota bacterium]
MANKVIMAIGAHIGDMELTVGGVLATHALKGDKIITVALTGGEKGNPPHLTIDAYRKQKEQEAHTFANMLNGEAIIFPYQDGSLPNNDEVKFKVCDLIRQYKPDVILTHWKNSMHKDHINTHYIVKDAQFYAGVPGFVRKDKPHFSPVYYAENWEDVEDYKPYVYVDIELGYELWLKALRTHWFVTNSKSFKYLEYYDHLSFVRGCEARKVRAQTFMIDEHAKKIIRDSF